MNARRMMLRMFVGSLGMTGIVGVSALLMPALPYEEELLGSSALLTAYSLAGLGMAFALSRAKRRLMLLGSAALGGASFFGWLAFIWIHPHITWQTEVWFYKMAGSPTIISVALGHAGLLVLIKFRRTRGQIVRCAAIVCSSIIGLWMLTWLWAEAHWLTGEMLVRIIGSLAIIGSLCTIASPVLAILDRLGLEQGSDSEVQQHVPVSLACPRCGGEQEFQANRKGKCSSCGLKIKVEVQEPRCECGYLLYGLMGDVCPECGREIEKAARWESKAGGDGEEVSA